MAGKSPKISLMLTMLGRLEPSVDAVDDAAGGAAIGLGGVAPSLTESIGAIGTVQKIRQSYR